MAGGAVGEKLSPQDERPSVLRRNASCFFFLRSGTAAGDKLLLLVPASSNFIIPTQHTLHPCSSVWYQTLSYLLWFLSLCGMNVGVMQRYLRGTSLLIQFDVRSKCRKINDKMYVKNASTKYMCLSGSPRSRNLSDSLCVEAVALGTNKPIVAMRDIDWLYFCLAMWLRQAVRHPASAHTCLGLFIRRLVCTDNTGDDRKNLHLRSPAIQLMLKKTDSRKAISIQRWTRKEIRITSSMWCYILLIFFYHLLALVSFQTCDVSFATVDILKNVGAQVSWSTIDFHCMHTLRHFSKCLLFRSTNKKT